MHPGLLNIALLGAASVQAGLIDTIEDSFFDLVSPADDHLSDITDRTQQLLQKVQKETGSLLGAVPEQAKSAWRTVVDEIPDGSRKLEQGMRNRLDKIMKKSKNHLKKPINTDGWDYHVSSSKFPEHSLRVKHPGKLGVDDTKQLSGYLDIGSEEEKHLFFWFFEARNDPKNAPVVLWLNGGPGCSSLTGLFFELGPSTIGPDLKPIRNEHAWNKNANVIYLDQPVGTGYSYNEGEEDVTDTVTAGQDTYAFLELFFQQFPEYLGRDFHIAGESYAGHYIPVFGKEILSHEDRSFNLTSLLVGNGLTDPLRQYDGYEKMACGDGGYPAVLDEEECEDMINAQPRCNQLIESCYASESAWVCVPASIYCNNVMMGPYQRTGRNVYDISQNCSGDNGLCYPELDLIEQYLNLDHVKEALGTEETEEYHGCNFDLNGAFLFHGDWMKPYYTAVADLLEAGLPQLYYSGDLDFICNWVGNEHWTHELPWSGHEKFAEKPLTPWVSSNGTEVGQKRNYKHYTFLRVYGAGHMVPHDQPESSLELLERWIGGDYKFA